jgi:hypothetical protein
VSQSRPKAKGASLHTLLVYEEEAQFCQYAGGSKLPVAVYDRERAVLEAGRRVAAAIGAKSVRVVFILDCSEAQNCSIVTRSKGPTTPPPLRSQNATAGVSKVKNEQC